MWKRFLGIMAAALCVLNLTVGSAFSADLVKVPTAWLDEHETFLMWYAKEKGWDKEAGLDIEMKLFNSGPDILNALPAGEWRFAAVGALPAMLGNRATAPPSSRRPTTRPRSAPPSSSAPTAPSPRSRAGTRTTPKCTAARDRARQDLPRHHADLVALCPQHVAPRPRPQGQRRRHQEHGPVAGRGRV